MRRALAVSILLSAEAVYGGESLAIAVCNLGKIPGAMVEQAEKEASLLFQPMAVQIHWLGCGRAEATVVPDFVVRLMLGAEASRGGLAAASAMGRAYLDDQGQGFMADTYYTRVQNLAAANTDVSNGKLLGAAIAHELGHLLIGAGHRLTGLMRGSWGRLELRDLNQGNLNFNRWERGVIVHRLQGRGAAHQNS